MSLALVLLALQAPSPAPAAAPRADSWEKFPVFVWREAHAGEPLPAELAEPFGGVILMRGEDSSWARERDLAYLVWNVAGRDALHLDADAAWSARVERWIETRDRSLLVREPCLDDPETLARLHATLDETLAKHGAQPGLGFVLGDEVSLTPGGDPFDLCRCEHSEQAWKAYARERGLPERAPLTDDVRLALLKDDFSLLGPWLARRRFNRENVQALLEGLRQRTVAGNDSATNRVPVGLLGCTGPTAFGGVALEYLACTLDFLECYRAGTAHEVVETWSYFRRQGFAPTSDRNPPMSLRTLFLADESAAGLAWGAWEQWLRGGNGLVLWSDAALAALSDEERERLNGAVTAIRALGDAGVRPPSLAGAPPGAGVALVDDPDAVAVSFLRDALRDGATWPRRRAGYQQEHGTRERKIRGWLRLLEDVGTPAACVPLASWLCEQGSADYPVLVLPELLVLDEDQSATLERHVDEGGYLVVDGDLGWIDRAGRPIEGSVIERLRKAHPERVLDAPRELESYLERRWNRERAAPVREFLRRIRSARRLPPIWSPIRAGNAASIPWLTNQWEVEGVTYFALLPNCVSAAERREHLRDLSLDLEPPPGTAIEWLHPVGGGTLRAGDAAVFRLRPTQAR